MDASTVVMIGAAVIMVAVVSGKSPEATSKGLNATVALFSKSCFFFPFLAGWLRELIWEHFAPK
jgi:hypothetical protein